VQDNILVQLREGASSEPIVFIHPIGGTLFTYKPLASRLTTCRAIYGIQDNLADCAYKQYDSIEEQATYYIQKIFEKLNANAVMFAGHSSGGTLAFEMARQCIDYGVEVQQVLMLDTWVKAPFDDKFKTYFQNIILRQYEKLDAANVLKDECAKSQWLNRIWQRMNLLFTYIPRPVPIQLLLCTASESVPEYIVNESENFAWKNLVKSLIKIPVSGNHETMLDLKYIDNLISKVNQYIK
jgi:thioesterase domain-containing protein